MKKTLHLTLFLAIVSGISGGLLSFANNLTAPIIAANENAKKFGALEVIFPGSEFEVILEKGDTLVKEAYLAKDKGYIYKIANQGFSGMLEYLVGIDNEGKVVGYVELNNVDTPGFGSRVGEEEFSNIVLSKTTQDTIDTIAGVTISSTAIIDAIYESFAMFNENAGIDYKAPETQTPDVSTKPIPNENVAMIVDSTDTTTTYEVISKGMADNTIHVIINNSDLTIDSIKYIEVNDTPDFVSKVNNEEYLSNYQGKTINDFDSVDIIAGSTLSSNAVKHAVKVALETASNAKNNDSVSPYTPVIVEENKDSTIYAVTIKSYMGDNRITVEFDNSNNILAIEFLEVNDTPEFIDKVNNEEYLSNYQGKSLSEYNDVDAAAGATESTKSLKEAIKMIIEEFGLGVN